MQTTTQINDAYHQEEPDNAAPRLNANELDAQGNNLLQELLAEDQILKQQIEQLTSEALQCDLLEDDDAKHEADHLRQQASQAAVQEQKLSTLIQEVRTDPRKKLTKKERATVEDICLVIHENSKELVHASTQHEIAEERQEEHRDAVAHTPSHASAPAPEKPAKKSSAYTGANSHASVTPTPFLRHPVTHAKEVVANVWHRTEAMFGHAVQHSAVIASGLHYGKAAVHAVMHPVQAVHRGYEIAVTKVHQLTQTTRATVAAIGAHLKGSGLAVLSAITAVESHVVTASAEIVHLPLSGMALQAVHAIHLPHFSLDEAEEELGELTSPLVGMFRSSSMAHQAIC